MTKDYPTHECVICKEETRINVDNGKKKVYVCHKHVDEGREIVKNFKHSEQNT